MSIYIQQSNFKGEDKLPKDIFSTNELQQYIDDWEEIYLQDLLGADLYALFKADFVGPGGGIAPTEPRFLSIWNAFAKDDQYCLIVRSRGMQSMLVSMIYFDYLRDSKVKKNIGGINKNVQANSSESTFHESNIVTEWNKGIDSYNAIQWCICDNPNNYDYDEYNGQAKGKISIP